MKPADFPISNMRADKGAQGELIAAAWLIGLGYQVFRNVSACGPADLVAWWPGEMPLLIDVKAVSGTSIYRRNDGSFQIPIGTSKCSGVHQLVVVNGSVVGFARKLAGGVEFYWPLECPERSAEIVALGSWKDAAQMRRNR